MKTLRKTVCALLALSLLCAGCSGAPAASSSQSAPASSGAVSAAGSSVPASSAAPATEADQEPVEISIFAPLFSDPPDMQGPFWTEWMRLTNSKLEVEWVPSGDYATKLNLKLASDGLPEVTVVESLSAPVINAISGGAFWGLSELLGDMSQYPNLRDKITPNAFKYTTYNGEIWGIPRSRPQRGCGFKIRKDWLDKLGLPLPTTLDEYTDALRAITAADLDGNGQNDTIGYICVGAPSTWYDNLKNCFGYSIPSFDADGGFIPPYLRDSYFDFIEYAAKMYADGLLPQEFVALKNQSGMDLFTTGQGASYSRDMWWDYQWEQSLRQTQPEATIVNLTLEGPVANNLSIGTGVNGGIYISSRVDREKVVRLLDYFEATATPEVTDLGFYGLEGVHHEVVDGARKLNDFGVKEITATSIVLGALDCTVDSLKYGKTDSASAPLEYNLAKREESAHYEADGQINIFGSLTSETWADAWPNYEEEFKSMETQAVVGQISLDAFRQYVISLREKPEMKQAFQEFAKSYEAFQ